MGVMIQNWGREIYLELNLDLNLDLKLDLKLVLNNKSSILNFL